MIKHVLSAAFFLIQFFTGFCVFKGFGDERYACKDTFEALTSTQIVVSGEEKEKCRTWYEQNVLYAGQNNVSPAYDFYLGTVRFRDDYKNWSFSVAKGETDIITAVKGDMKLTVKAVCREERATCEWTAYLENTGDKNSAVVNRFSVLDFTFDTGDGDIYYSAGSNNAAADFTLYKRALSTLRLLGRDFSGCEGKSTTDYMPYFNISGVKSGLVFGCGWTGQWKTRFVMSRGGLHVTTGQQLLNTYLMPGESLRSPLMSISFYDGGNPLKGFNLFRSYVLNDIYPDNMRPFNIMTEAPLADGVDGTVDRVRALGNEGKFDFVMYDAVWYFPGDISGWWGYAGNWAADTVKFPNGFGEVSEKFNSVGVGTILWYEPERVRKDTEFDQVGTENGWLIDKGDSDDYLWNLSDDAACDWLCRYMAKSLVHNGVSIYRQDFNIMPIDFWKTADGSVFRRGITENKYVTNLYRYWDYLLENIDGLLIDNCASGGMRLDLETAKRSVPLWRSDYECNNNDDINEAIQSQSWGISLWLPLSSTNNVWESTEYDILSRLTPIQFFNGGVVYGADFQRFYDMYMACRACMTGNYYPLTVQSMASGDALAMQYDNDGHGVVMAYRRSGITDARLTLKLNGLNPDATYRVTDAWDGTGSVELSGAALMSEGFTATFKDCPDAAVFRYELI